MVGTGTERVKTEGRAQSLPYFCMIDFEYLRKNGLLLFEYIRGSHLYGLNTENSDEDHGGIYIEPLESIMGLGIGFPEVVCDKNNDETWYSFKKYMSLLLNSNPNILESLYVPKDKILARYKGCLELMKEVIEVSDICHIYDNSNQPIRIFKKRKTECYYDDSSEWDKERIINFTGIANAVKKDLNLKK